MMANKIVQTADCLGNATRRGFLSGIAGIIVIASSMSVSSMPTKAGSQSTADILAKMPQFIRELVATEMGVSVENINELIDLGDEEIHEAMCDVVIRVGDHAKVLQEQRRGSAS